MVSGRSRVQSASSYACPLAPNLCPQSWQLVEATAIHRSRVGAMNYVAFHCSLECASCHRLRSMQKGKTATIHYNHNPFVLYKCTSGRIYVTSLLASQYVITRSRTLIASWLFRVHVIRLCLSAPALPTAPEIQRGDHVLA